MQTETATAPAERTAALSASSALVQHVVSYRGFRFAFDDVLASTALGEAVGALVGEAQQLDSPEHLRFTFDDRVPADTFDPLDPQLLIYPARAYVNISPSAAVQVGALQALIDDRAVPAQGPLPRLPLSLEEETLHAQLRFLEFQGGQGVRYLARYGPSEELFYTFQGLSDDGDYYIAFFYPVSADALTAVPTAAPTEPGAGDKSTAGIQRQCDDRTVGPAHRD